VDKKTEHRLLRKEFGSLGWAMLVYYFLLRGCVMLVGVIQLRIGEGQIQAGMMTRDELIQLVSSNGWGYLLTIGVGLLLLWLWKGKDFCTKEMFSKGRPMKVGDFFCLLCVFLMSQFLFSMVRLLMEFTLNQFGLTALKAVQSATSRAESLSMFLYMAFGAPIVEEILCRGLVLRPLMKYGKRFAILMSAFFFGLLHGNIVQTPFAFAVGLVLGYVAVEYNILWAMVLHMINNLVMGDLLIRLFGEMVGGLLVGLLILGFAVAGVIILIDRGKESRDYVNANKVNNEWVHCFFTSPGVIAVSVVLMVFLVGSLDWL
jgi:membrane protease YdiL (CAAX protease family)